MNQEAHGPAAIAAGLFHFHPIVRAGPSQRPRAASSSFAAIEDSVRIGVGHAPRSDRGAVDLAIAVAEVRKKSQRSPVTVDDSLMIAPPDAAAGSGGALLATAPAICRVTASTAAQCSATANGGTLRFEGGTTGQVGDCAFCGGTPNNISGAYQNLGGNSSLATCADCAALPWRNASNCDASDAADHCERFDGTAADANANGLPDGCESLADLLPSGRLERILRRQRQRVRTRARAACRSEAVRSEPHGVSGQSAIYQGAVQISFLRIRK